jgi:pimeloyl-ACP methyl ester carboxylesterase
MKFSAIGTAVCLFLLSFHCSAIDLHECRIGPDQGVRKIKAECGKLAVAENRDQPSRMIELNIAIVRTQSINKKADPVLMLAGGPGQAAVESYASVSSGFAEILKDRDVVLVDQRGTGESNPLKCQFDESLTSTTVADQELMREQLAKCVSGLDADTRYYTTSESIRDLEMVREALGIAKWNLLGISYGTRKALTYMKMFPDSLRSVILDGVMPQQEAMPQSHEKNLIDALNLQFQQCQEQPACRDTFGDVDQQMRELLARVEAEKPTIRLQDFLTGEYQDLELSQQHIAIAIRLFSYSANTIALLPLMIDKANNGQPETIASQAGMIAKSLEQSITNVELSIICAEDAPFYEDDNGVEPLIFGESYIDNIAVACAVWPHIPVDRSFKDPVASDLPVLLLSGELDPVTPPAFADLAMQTLSNARHLVARGQGHNVFPLGCMPELIAEFVDDPDAELDTDCMGDFDYTPFFINMMGPNQ